VRNSVTRLLSFPSSSSTSVIEKRVGFVGFSHIPHFLILLYNISFVQSSYLIKDPTLPRIDEKNEASASVDKTIRNERRRLFDFIRRRVRTDADAEDIVQDVFYQLVTSYSITEPIEQLTSWLFTVAKNKIIDWYRKRRPQLFDVDTESEYPFSLEDVLFDPTQQPDEVFVRSIFWTALAEALDDLPEEQRQVFVMHELEGKTFKEIAEATGVPLNTLLSRKRYAVLFLREQLKELYDDTKNL